jgi:hypothetical protein
MSTHKGPAGDEHEHVDVDPYIPTGQCAICAGMAIDDRLPEDRGPDNPYESGAQPEIVEPEQEGAEEPSA